MNPRLRSLFIRLVLAAIAGMLIFNFVKDHISCVGGFPVYKKSKKEVAQKKVEAPPPPVKVYKVSKVSFRDTLPALGTIKGFREFDMKFPISGTVEYINFREGEKITQGDIIASLDQKEVLLKMEYAKIEFDKQKKLFDLGSTLESKWKQSQLEYQSAKQELDKTNLVALSDGYIGSIEVEKGSFITPQDRICAFVDFKDVFVEFGVIEKDIARVKEAQNIELTLDSFPDQVFKGQVDSVSPVVEGHSRTVKVRAKISNPDEKIKPGMFGRVNLLVYEKDAALVIPSSSFKKKEDQYYVYIVHAEEAAGAPGPESPEAPAAPAMPKTAVPQDSKKAGAEGPQEAAKSSYGTIEQRTIEVNYATPDAIEVKEGVEEGDLVVVDVEQEMKDKTKVEITETQEGIF